MSRLSIATAALTEEQRKPRLLRHILPFIELSEEAGVDIDALLAEVGLSRRALRNAKTQIPNYQLLWLLEQLIAQSGDPEIGLRAGERTLLVRADFLGDVVKHFLQMSSDLLTMLQLLAYFGTHVYRNMQIRVTVDDQDQLVTLTAVPNLPPPPEAYDCVAAASCALAEALGGPRLRPIEIRLPRSCPTDPRRYEEFLRARVVFDAPQFQLIYAREAFSSPPLHEEPSVQCSSSTALQAQGGNTLALQIRTHVLARLAEGVPLLPSVAKKLGLSARTLRRRLAEARSSYAELVDEARRERALTLAHRAELDVGRLAELTGFTDASAFARAFRRWTGQRPREFMRSVRERASTRAG